MKADGIRAASRPRSYQRMRRAFWVEDANAVRLLTLLVEHEEGFVAWLNGVEIARPYLSLRARDRARSVGGI